MMRKWIYFIATAFLMVIVSRFLVRIVDATVQIDDEWWLLLILVALANLMIAALSRMLYRRGQRKNTGRNK